MSQRHADPVAPAPVPAARASRRETATRRLGLALAAPALLYILVFLAFPLLYNLWLSATDASRLAKSSRADTSSVSATSAAVPSACTQRLQNTTLSGRGSPLATPCGNR